uniref:Succinate dehydrogenase [ubiquinone] cytochrome b small subunit n=1 Tax=Dunaliella tertiolecta TaxID=3047 RepID=A0A7S3QKD0_DUNTE|mmetsp:Transcript_22708/g.62686  ORF Transcript_22708/g.62686 Transcript_22708/m.62686 type:complete len:121 (+) Transcript_22708:67-429(+)
MNQLNKVLTADVAGHQFLKAHEYSNYALAAATPLAVLSKKDGAGEAIADALFACAIPVHMHIGMNACITDYLPKVARGPARVCVLGMSAFSFLGLMKINAAGPGITQTVKGLWHRPSPSQ